MEVLRPQPETANHDCPVEPLDLPRVVTHFSDEDLVIRRFHPETAAPSLARKGKVRAA
jgi:hypothetical protein